MLHEFLTANRTELIGRCIAKVAQRPKPKGIPKKLEHGIPLFIDQVIKTLQAEQASAHKLSIKVSGTSGGDLADRSEIGATATRHGAELSKQGFTFDQVVRAYGDLCQAITELAFKDSAPINVDEFRTLNRCLDNAIADAVTEFAYQQDNSPTNKGVQASDERLQILAREMRGHIQTATLAISAIKAGNVGLNGVTGAILDLSLVSMQSLINRSLGAVNAIAELPARHEVISMAGFIAQVKISTALQAQARECKFTVTEVDKGLAVDVDRDMLFSVVVALLENAFKFTKQGTEVTLSAFGAGERVLIEIADHCGGLPAGAWEKMFLPSTQSVAKAGIRLGLPICRRSVEANNGVLSVRDAAGAGCTFIIDLPRAVLSQPGVLTH
jgi:signal transduction histidine kinase